MAVDGSGDDTSANPARSGTDGAVTEGRLVRGHTGVGPAGGTRLPPVPASVPRARAFVREALTGRCDAEGIEDAVLAVSEIVTNAIEHAGTPVTLTVSTGAGRARVAVSDSNRHVPRRRVYAVTASTGRGLRLLDQLTAAWGIEVREEAGPGAPAGKTVWFEVKAHCPSVPAAGASETVGPEGSTSPTPASAEPDRGHVQDSDGAEQPAPVLLLALPLALYVGWRQHAEELLREQFLSSLDRDAVEETVSTQAAAAGALSALEDEIVAASIDQSTPRIPTESAMAVDAELRLSADVCRQFETLERTLSAAAELAREIGLAVSRSDLRDLERWIFGQVRTQVAGAKPVPWSERAPG